MLKVKNFCEFGGWKENVVTREQAGAIMNRCLLRIDNRCTSQALSKWIEFVRWELISAKAAEQDSSRSQLKASYEGEMKKIRASLSHDQETRLHELRLQTSAIEEAHQQALKALKVR